MLGIDLRVTAVKVVEVEKTETGSSIKAWGMTEIPFELVDKHPESETAKADALRKLIQVHNMISKEATVVVGGPEAYVKLFTLVALSAEEALQALKWKFAEELSFPVEEGIFDFFALPKSDAKADKTDYVGACISQKLFNETQTIINKAGLTLAGITVLPFALREFYKSDLAEGVVSLVYLGKRTTNISIFRQGSFEFNRELAIGGENITLAMAGVMVSPEGKLEVSHDEAEKIKVESGVPIDLNSYPRQGDIPLIQLQAMVRPSLEKIQTEISRTFEYYKEQSGEAAVTKIILTGGSALTPHLKEFLSAGLGLPIITPEDPAKLDVRLSAAAGAGACVPCQLNLLPDEIKFRWQKLRARLLGPLVVLPAVTALLLFIYFLIWLRFFSLQFELNNLNKKLAVYQPQLTRLERIEQASQENDKRAIALKAYEEKGARLPKVFEEISQAIPNSAQLLNLKLTPAELQLSGLAFSKGEAAETVISRFVLNLSNSPIFDNVALIQAQKNNGYQTEAFDFEIKAKLREQ